MLKSQYNWALCWIAYVSEIPIQDANDESSSHPLPRRYGIVVEVDPEGDTKVDFPRIEGRQWATWVNTFGWFERLWGMLGGLKQDLDFTVDGCALCPYCVQSFASLSGLVCALNGGVFSYCNFTCGGIIDRKLKKMQKDSVSTQTLTSATPLSCEECPSGFE